MPESSGLFFEKETNPSAKKALNLFERTRYAYLSAATDPKAYRKKWEKAVDNIKHIWEELGDFSQEMKNYVDEKTLFYNDTIDPSSHNAKKLYENISEMRYASTLVNDPFSKKLKDEVLETLLEEPSIMAHFLHWAIRSGKESLSDDDWGISDTKPDEITGGHAGLDLEVEDVGAYIIEHYGDGKDTKRVKGKLKAANKLLEQSFLNSHDKKEWAKLVALDIKKSDEKKAREDFIKPNKPMYRIFDIDDIHELKGFSGEWVVQEKYDGMRIQIHKLDNNVKIYSYNGKDITDKCPEQVKVMNKKHFGECILDAELILFKGNKALHRADTIARVFHGKYPDATLRAHVFDIMRHEDSDLLDTELEERIKTLFHQYSMHSDEMLAFPSKKDTRLADSIKEVESYSKEIMKIPTAEGVVIKDRTSTYYVGTRKNPKWIKWKKFVDLDLIVLEKKSTKSGLNSYTLGAGPLAMEDARKVNAIKIKERYYANVGKALNTKEDVEIGTVVRVTVDEVKKKGENYSIYTAKIIEIPEVKQPDKLVTLELLSQGTKKSLKYDIKALEKGYSITDYIHGETTIIAKYDDLDGFTLFGFGNNNLMSKNALLDIDVWKEEMKDKVKTASRTLMTILHTQMQKDINNKMTLQEIHDYLIKEHPDDYKELFDGDIAQLTKHMKIHTDMFISSSNDTWKAAPDFLGKEVEYSNEKQDIIEKEYKTPKEYRKGKFKIYLRKDGNLNLSFKLGDEKMTWLIDINSTDDIFGLFGKSSKFQAQPTTNINVEDKVIDSGKVELGVQRNGYHEYMLDGNKFDTRIHFRVVPVEKKDKWVCWTGFKQKRLSSRKDEGVWNIYDDRYKKLTIQEGE